MTAMPTSAAGHRWPEYFIEAALLAAFMVSAVAFTALLQYPASPARHRPTS